jgi:hypothetical protein
MNHEDPRSHIHVHLFSFVQVPQQLSNTLWALGNLGWYMPDVYCRLDRALVPLVDKATPQVR